MQEELFRQAKEEMQQQSANDQSSWHSNSSYSPSSQSRAAADHQAVEQQVNALATKLTQEYLLQKEASSTMNEQQVFLVFKFLHTPEDVLVDGMCSLQPPLLTQFYRKLAKQLHPDKNSHPQAKEAF